MVNRSRNTTPLKESQEFNNNRNTTASRQINMRDSSTIVKEVRNASTITETKEPDVMIFDNVDINERRSRSNSPYRPQNPSTTYIIERNSPNRGKEIQPRRVIRVEEDNSNIDERFFNDRRSVREESVHGVATKFANVTASELPQRDIVPYRMRDRDFEKFRNDGGKGKSLVGEFNPYEVNDENRGGFVRYGSRVPEQYDF